MQQHLEEFRPIPGFDNYTISSEGRVRNKHQRTLRPYGNGTKKNYQKVKLCDNEGNNHQLYVHRLVASAFLPRPQGCDEVNHLDNCPMNNRKDNLEWSTTKQNAEFKTVCKFFTFETKLIFFDNN